MVYSIEPDKKEQIIKNEVYRLRSSLGPSKWFGTRAFLCFIPEGTFIASSVNENTHQPEVTVHLL